MKQHGQIREGGRGRAQQRLACHVDGHWSGRELPSVSERGPEAEVQTLLCVTEPLGEGSGRIRKHSKSFLCHISWSQKKERPGFCSQVGSGLQVTPSPLLMALPCSREKPGLHVVPGLWES